MRFAPRGRVILVALLMGCVSRQKYVALEREHFELTQRYAAVREASDGVRMRLAELEADLAAMEASASAAEAMTPPSFYVDLLREFRPLLDDEDLEVVVYPDRTVLAFERGMTFASGSARLDREDDATIRALADLIRQHPERQFVVEGHTDAVPIATAAYPDNWALGAARARAVIEALVEAGADPDQLAAASYSATDPLEAEAGFAGREANRRVQVTVTPTLDEIPGEEELLDAARVRRATEERGEPREPERERPPEPVS